jgi:hypothetical protein
MTTELSSSIIMTGGGGGASSPVLVAWVLVRLYHGRLPCCLPGRLQHSLAKCPGLPQ